ncbi:MAG TPA: CBS domain-containing protein [Thermoleophilaceae bacterium]|jgi:CBS domain-containing protein|nr:CBS domain-containing protein [Thermoleophilaceae bacterium]
MADTIRDIMSGDPKTVDASATIEDAAKIMAENDIGNVLVVENDEVQGIITDRDIVVRVIAKGNGADASVREAASTDLETLSPDDSVEDAIKKMEQADVRRLPVVDDGKPAGVVSLGDLAKAKDQGSALADISSASPNN